ncbi:MAG: hypothetical protein CV089_05670 [Nitrospira sp. WS110]|nr:hypothetical protein [Nitrospira sp. WS110]
MVFLHSVHCFRCTQIMGIHRTHAVGDILIRHSVASCLCVYVQLEPAIFNSKLTPAHRTSVT